MAHGMTNGKPNGLTLGDMTVVECRHVAPGTGYVLQGRFSCALCEQERLDGGDRVVVNGVTFYGTPPQLQTPADIAAESVLIAKALHDMYSGSGQSFNQYPPTDPRHAGRMKELQDEARARGGRIGDQIRPCFVCEKEQTVDGYNMCIDHMVSSGEFGDDSDGYICDVCVPAVEYAVRSVRSGAKHHVTGAFIDTCFELMAGRQAFDDTQFAVRVKQLLGMEREYESLRSGASLRAPAGYDGPPPQQGVFGVQATTYDHWLNAPQMLDLGSDVDIRKDPNSFAVLFSKKGPEGSSPATIVRVGYEAMARAGLGRGADLLDAREPTTAADLPPAKCTCLACHDAWHQLKSGPHLGGAALALLEPASSKALEAAGLVPQTLAGKVYDVAQAMKGGYITPVQARRILEEPAPKGIAGWLANAPPGQRFKWEGQRWIEVSNSNPEAGPGIESLPKKESEPLAFLDEDLLADDED